MGGCDYSFTIQVLFLNHWVDVLDLLTRTSRGGGELVSACSEIMKKGIKGDYGSQYSFNVDEVDKVTIVSEILKKFLSDLPSPAKVTNEIVSKKRPREDASDMKDTESMGTDGSPTERKENKGNVLEDEEEDDEEEDEEEEGFKEDEYYDESRYLFYSKTEFETYVRLVEPPYCDLLRPVLLWCDLALCACGTTYDASLSDRPEAIDEITVALRANQQVLLKRCKKAMLKQGVPQEKVDELTVEHLKADDVRIAVDDFEDNTKRVRAGDTSSHFLKKYDAVTLMNMVASGGRSVGNKYHF